jgi:sortase (surface protein transpeptidase)
VSAWGVDLPVAEDARPVRVRVPGLGVDAPVVELGVAADGTLEVPGATTDVGWLRTSAVPGAAGPAVLAGHVDSASGPAVFARLDELIEGDRVEVELEDGSAVVFRVVAVSRFPKDAFPTDAVYGPAPTPQLRLITCGGEFDRDARSYQDNVVVTALAA